MYIPRVEPAHVVIALHTAVHNSRIALLPYTLLCHVLIDPVWVAPHAWVYLSKLHRCACVVCNGLFECGVEVAVVQENIGIVKPAIEMSLDGPYGLDDALQFLISCQYDKYCIGTGTVGLRF